MKIIIHSILILLLSLLLANCEQNTTVSLNSPNFLLILADDLDYSEIACYGGEIPTPNIDKLANEGILFTNFYATTDDSKTRSMLLTGTSQAQIPGTTQLKPEAKTIAQLLQEVGYRTIMAGKWNLGGEKINMPIEKGFDQSFALVQKMSNHLGGIRYLPAIYRENNNIKEISGDFYSTQYFTRKLLSFLANDKQQQKKPFFAYLSFTAPHYPLQAPESSIQNFKAQYNNGYEAIYQKRLTNQLALGIQSEMDNLVPADWSNLSPELKAYEARKMEIYAAMVNDLDKHIGQVIDFLKVSKQYENTVIIFLADGGISEPRELKTYNYINNALDNLGKANSMITLGTSWTNIKLGTKSTPMELPFDNAVKVPFILRSSLRQKAGSQKTTISTINDITPTVLKIIGLSHPSESYFEDVLSMEGQPLLQ